MSVRKFCSQFNEITRNLTEREQWEKSQKPLLKSKVLIYN